MLRHTLHFTGHVQGVGFRATTQRIAEGFTVAGYVQNLPDGRVRLVAEGDPAELDAFLAALRRRLGQHIHDTEQSSQSATQEFGPPTPGALTIRY